jgi:outer membrane lipoprotein LolB
MLRNILLSLLVAIVSACASLPSKPVTEESHQLWQQRQQQLKSLTNWAIRGRVALFVDDKVYNLGMAWTRKDQHHIINLEAALGQGMIRLEKTPGHAEMTTSEGETYYGHNAQQLLTRTTQLTLPVEGLETWIKGLGHENSPNLPDIDADGRAISLSQDGWKINYFDYELTTLKPDLQLELPHKLYLKRENLALKIVIDQWVIDPVTETSPLFSDFPE